MWTRLFFVPLLLSVEVRGSTLDVTSFGAVGNCTTIAVNISSGSATVTANSGTPFAASDVGKVVQIYGGGAKATITTTGWGSSPTNNQDLVAIISGFSSSTIVTLDRICGNTTNATFMTYGTNNVTAFSNCIAAATAGASTVHIPAGNYLLMNPSALNASFVQSGMFDPGTPALSLFNGNIHFWGDGTNSTILTGNGAWQIKGRQQAFRGYLFNIASVTNNGSLIFSNIQFNGSATRNHSQLWTDVPAAPTDGSGWDVTHHAITDAADPTSVTRFGATNCLFIHWHGETIQGIDAGHGFTDLGNCWFIDGNATVANFNGLHSYHDYLCSDYYQFAEDGQFTAASGTSTITRGVISNIDHAVVIALTGADASFRGPAYLIQSNIFRLSGKNAVATAGIRDVTINGNDIDGGTIALGIAGNQGNFWNSNIVVSFNTFTNAQVAVMFLGHDSVSVNGTNRVDSVNVTNNTGSVSEAFGEAITGGGAYSTNVLFSGNTSVNKGLDASTATGQWFLDDLSNVFPPNIITDGVGVSNAMSYAFGARFQIVPNVATASFYAVDSQPLKIPDGAIMLVTNKGTFSTKVYPSSALPAGFVTLAVNDFIKFYWTNGAWLRFATNIAVSCSQADVQTAIAGSIPGDTVVVPSGTCDWTTSVVFTNQITVIAQVNLATYIQDSIVNTSDNANSSCVQMSITATPAIPARFSGFHFITGSRATKLFDSGTVNLNGSSSLVRVDNNWFGAKQNIGIGGGEVFGCIDRNVFDCTNFTQPMKLKHSSYGGQSFGDGGWALPPWTNGWTEDASALYVENNFFTNSGSSGLGPDGQDGERVVFRYNTFDRMICGGHGTETTQRHRGVRLKDVYNNLFIEHGDSEAGHYRSGTGVIVSNEFHNSSSAFTIRAYRLDSFTTPWGQAIGTNAWDKNDPTVFASGTVGFGGGGSMTDNTQAWTVNQWQGFSIMNANTGLGSWVLANTANSLTYNISTFGTYAVFNGGQTYQFRKVITILDEPGRGKGDLINTAAPAWPNQALEPIYSWSNTFFSVTSTTIGNGGYYPVVDGQELVNGKNVSWVPYIYPHPLVTGTNAPPPPTPSPTKIARVTILRVGVTKVGP